MCYTCILFFHINFSQQTVGPYNGSSVDKLFVKNTDGTRSIETTPPVVATGSNISLVRLPIAVDVNNVPHAYDGQKFWTTREVLMPWNSDEVIFCGADNEPRSRWNVILDALGNSIRSSDDLEMIIKMYNPSYCKSFSTLEKAIDSFNPKTHTQFFMDTLPTMIKIASDLQNIFPCGIPLLKANQNGSITMSKFQSLTINICSFLCMFDENRKNFPTINFNSLYEASGSGPLEKLKCFMNYFIEAIDEFPSGCVTYQRRYITDVPDWRNDNKTLASTKVHITHKGKIEAQILV